MTENQQLVHRGTEHLHGPEEVPYGEDELVVVCILQDGRPYVKSFVEHYLSLGVRHMVFLDNGSTDGTVEALKGYDDVTVLRTTLPFKEYENLMRQYLIARFGKDRWSLYVDIDELFDYPYSDVIGLDSLLGYLNSKSYTAVAAQRLDMFPEKLLSSGWAGSPDQPLKELYRFCNISNISRMNPKEHRRFRDNMLGSDDIEVFYGDLGPNIFDIDTPPLLTKFPLVFSDGRVKPFDGSAHWVNKARIADLTCVLFHYKFLHEHFHKQAARDVLRHKKSLTREKILRGRRPQKKSTA